MKEFLLLTAWDWEAILYLNLVNSGVYSLDGRINCLLFSQGNYPEIS
jgi:hypothetical protein